MSKQLELPKNAVFRITQTLLARGYLTRDSETMAFQLTSQLLKLAPPRWNGTSLPELSREAMATLRDSTRETVQLGVLSGLEGIIIDQVEGLEPLRIVVDLGLRFFVAQQRPWQIAIGTPPHQRTQSRPLSNQAYILLIEHYSPSIMNPTLSPTLESESPGSVPALDRSLDILELLSRSSGGLTLSELSKQLELPKKKNRLTIRRSEG